MALTLDGAQQGVTQGFGNETRDSLRVNRTGWFIGVISSFPENKQVLDALGQAAL